MKERVDSTKVLQEPGPLPDAAVVAGVTKLDTGDMKADVKEEDGPKSCETRPLSHKAGNGESDAKLENAKPGSVVGSESRKSSPQARTPQLLPSGGTTPASLTTQQTMVTSQEPPFMQQQSQIFVFSTMLANEAADSVRHGHCKSIIQYHMDHPNTKAFLQKNPLKANNFKQSMPMGMMGDMKSQQGPGMTRMLTNWGPNHHPGMDGMMGPEGMMPNGPHPPGSMMMGDWQGPGCGSLHPHTPMGSSGYPLGNMMDMEGERMMGGAQNPSSISSSKIPDENLTIEQRQHRSRSLAQLTKIHKMLMGGSKQRDGRHPHPGFDDGPGGPGMYPGRPGMLTSQQQAMMSQHAMSQGGMMPHGMMPPQHIMAQQSMTPYGYRGPPGMGPPRLNGKEQYQAQNDWFQIQREFYMERQHHMQHMVANRGLHMDSGPPPPYYTSGPQKHGDICSPPLTNMNGIRMPMHSSGPMGPGMDTDPMGMYGGPPEMCRPPHMGMEPMPGMHGYPPHMPPQGPIDPLFDPSLTGGTPQGMGPGPPGLSFPRNHGPLHQGHTIDSNGMIPSMKGPNHATLHRAGNPEQFNPETMGGVVPHIQVPSGTNSSKPPPSYAQAQKRKRSSDVDDSYTKGNLQQTPSPTKIQYHLNQFEGQELTITKQLNSAYVAGDRGDESGTANSAVGGNTCDPISGASVGHFNNHINSPLHGPSSNKGPHSNSSQTSAHMVSSPGMSAPGPSPQQGPATPHSTTHPVSAASSGANMRLSHFDLLPLSNGINSSAPHTSATKSSSLSNITSTSLANLAKGVENLSNQMQQNMMQGGPFHSIQVQGQMTSSNSANSNNSSNNSNNFNGSISSTIVTTSSSPTTLSSSHPVTTVAIQTTNNTCMASSMSASQTHIPNHSPMNSYLNMPNMISESSNMSTSQCSMGAGMMGGGPRSGMSHHLTQVQDMMNSMGPIPDGLSPGMAPGPPMVNPVGTIPQHQPNFSSSIPATPSIHKGQFASPPLSHSHLSGPAPLSDITSQSFPITSNSHSCVQIQQKGQNTIQYLPANPPTSQPSLAKDMEYNMPRFPASIQAMDGKSQPSTLQYFPNSSPAGHRPPQMSNALATAAAMGPEFANQATIAMQQSAAMMSSPSIPDLQTIQGNGPSMTPSSMGPIGPNPMMGGPDHMLGMGGNFGHMRPGHSPGSLHSMPPGLGPGSLECVSPIPGMCGYANNGPSIEQAQAQAQAHAAMMMQGNNQLPVSSPHGTVPPSPHIGPMPPCGGPSPHMGPMPTCGVPSPHMGPMPPCSGPSPHMGPMPPCGGPSPHTASMIPMPGTSNHGPIPPGGVPGPSVHGPPMSVQSPHGTMPCSIPGTSPHGPMPGTIASHHGHIPGPPPHHSAMMGPMTPHGHMGHLHGPVIPPGSMPRQPGMGGMRMSGPGMGGMPGHYGMQYPSYPPDYYPSGPQRGPPHHMMPGMMGGPGHSYGMMSNMPGPG